MQNSVKQFFVEIHASHFRQRGYKKIRHTFHRELDGYIERVQFQGSSWNDANSPWLFYINFGVEFSGLPARSPCRDFPATHCWTRIEALVPRMPPEYRLPEGDVAKFAAKIARCVEKASLLVADRLPGIRANYERSRSPQLSCQFSIEKATGG